MFVKKLELKNFQCIKDFDAEFNGDVYLISGENEVGKSTILKSIGILLSGNREFSTYTKPTILGNALSAVSKSLVLTPILFITCNIKSLRLIPLKYFSFRRFPYASITMSRRLVRYCFKSNDMIIFYLIC